MTTPIFDIKHERTILENVREGMRVLDANNQDLGRVDFVYLGEAGPLASSASPATISQTEDGTEEFLWILQRAAGKEDLPEELRKRLMRNGFIHVDVPGLLAHNRYVLPDQITTVMDDAVVLRATRQELIKEP